MLAVCATESLHHLSQNPYLSATVLSNSKSFKSVLSNLKYIKVEGSLDSPVFHLRLNEEVVRVGDVSQKDKVLQEIVDEVLKHIIYLLL